MIGGRTAVRVAAGGLAVAIAVSGCTRMPVPATTTPATATVSYGPGADGIGDSLYPKAGNGGYDVANYDLDVHYDPTSLVLTGTAVITALATANLSRFDLDLHGLTVSALTVDGTAARVTRTADELVVTPATPLPTGQKFTVTVRYAGIPQAYSDPGLGTDGFLTSDGGAVAIGEPEVAASWYPVNDHPRDKATYTIKITAPDGLESLSNGLRADTRSAGGNTTTTWVVTAPMASYLATMVVGHYRVHESTYGGKPVIIAVASTLGSYVDTALARTPEVIDFLETQFGPYPFDALGGIAIDDRRVRFALENQTRPIYADTFFHAGADDSWVIAHELAHQWYGDSVSVSSWQDIWLNEGFATYAEWLWSEHLGKLTTQQTFDRTYASMSADIWASPPGNPTRDQVFGYSVYYRGAMTLHALRIKVGDAAFFTIIKDWAKQRAGGNGATADFIALAEKDSGKDLRALFAAWLYETTKPVRPVA